MTSIMVHVSNSTPRHIHVSEHLLSNVKVAVVFFNLGTDHYYSQLALHPAWISCQHFVSLKWRDLV